MMTRHIGTTATGDALRLRSDGPRDVSYCSRGARLDSKTACYIGRYNDTGPSRRVSPADTEALAGQGIAPEFRTEDERTPHGFRPASGRNPFTSCAPTPRHDTIRNDTTGGLAIHAQVGSATPRSPRRLRTAATQPWMAAPRHGVGGGR